MNIAIILSGGTGTRLGSQIPKQYIEIADKPIISCCLKAVADSSLIDAICIVAAEEWKDYIITKCNVDTKELLWALPGRNRQESIYHGLLCVKDYCDSKGMQRTEMRDAINTVFIHDAARPNLTVDMIEEYYAMLSGYDGVLPVLPMKDTVYLSDNQTSVSQLLPREKIYAGQAPEIFVFDKYYLANKMLLPERILEINGSTEPAILAKMNIRMVPGTENNYKITTTADLERFQTERIH